MSEETPDPLELEGLPDDVDIKAWEGTVQGDAEGLGGPPPEGLPPDVPEDLDTSGWPGTQQGDPEATPEEAPE